MISITSHPHTLPHPPDTGLKLYSILDLERLGFRYPQPHMPPDPQDVATFSYTSGTTGGPKVSREEGGLWVGVYM